MRKAALRESDIEKYLYSQIKKMGGECLKWESQHKAGLPDRLIFIDGRFFLVELKRENGKLSEAQKQMHSRFEKQGFPVLVLYGLQEVDGFLESLKLKD